MQRESVTAALFERAMFIDPSSPCHGARIESFNNQLRNELLGLL